MTKKFSVILIFNNFSTKINYIYQSPNYPRCNKYCIPQFAAIVLSIITTNTPKTIGEYCFFSSKSKKLAISETIHIAISSN